MLTKENDHITTLFSYLLFQLRRKNFGLKSDEKLVAPSAISDKTVVRMKLTDSCVFCEGGEGGKIGFSPEPDGYRAE